MANFTTHGILEARDVDDIVEDLTEMLERSRSAIVEDVRDIISAGRYDNNDADDFFQVGIDILAYGVLQGDDSGVDVMGDSRSYEKVLKQAFDIAVGVYVISDRQLADELSDREYDDFAAIVETHADVLENMKGGGRNRSRSRGRDSRSRSRNRDDRNDRNSRSRGRDTGKRASSYGRNRDERDDRPSRGSRGKTPSRGVSGVRTPYGGNSRKAAVREEREERPARKLDDAAHYTQPKLVLAEKSKIVPTYESTTARSFAINPSKQGVFHVAANDAGVIETIIDYNEEGMEEYEVHEIKRSAVSTNKDGGVVVPQVDFRKLPDLGTVEAEEAAKTAKIIAMEPFTFCSDLLGIRSTVLETKLLSDADYTIAKGDQYRPQAMPQSIIDLLEGADKYSTFESWYNVMQLIQERIPSMSKVDSYTATSTLTFLEDNLRFLFNNLLAIVLSKTATMDSFIKYYQDGMAYLKQPAQADEYRIWTEMEREYLRHNFSMVDPEQRPEMMTSGILYPILEDTVDVTYNWFKTNMIAVRASGDLLADQLSLSNDDYITQVEFKYTPEFYSACERLVAYRNKNLKMSAIIMLDALGNQLMVLASNVNGGVIKIRKI